MPSERPPIVPTLAPMSPKAAAVRAGVSRRSIMRAITSHELPAIRDNRNHWQIALQDLERWAFAQGVPSGHAQPDADTSPTPDAARELAVAQAIIGQLEARLSEAEARRIATETDRDHWRAQAETLAARLAEPTPRRRRWPWSK